jgi:hypothetical protein
MGVDVRVSVVRKPDRYPHEAGSYELLDVELDRGRKHDGYQALQLAVGLQGIDPSRYEEYNCKPFPYRYDEAISMLHYLNWPCGLALIPLLEYYRDQYESKKEYVEDTVIIRWWF